MKTIKNVLESRKEQLRKLKKDKERALKSMPEGYLRICKKGKQVQYYYRRDPKDFNGVYIPQKILGWLASWHKGIMMKKWWLVLKEN